MSKKHFLVGVMMSMCVVLTCTAQPISAGATFEVGFSPRNGSLDLVLKGIRAAHKQILVAAYTFTSKPVSAALVTAQRRGVHVFVVADAKSNEGRSALQVLASSGIQVRLDRQHALMHNKFMVIDDDCLQLGSFNYTAAAADQNAENVLTLWRVPNLAYVYMTNWSQLWAESTPLRPGH